MAGLVVQISCDHLSRTTGATVDDCHDVCPHLRVVWKQVLQCRQLSLKICGTHGEENSKPHVLESLISSAFSMSLFKFLSSLDGMIEVVYFGSFRWGTRFACCRPNSFQLPVAHTMQPVFAIVPDLVSVHFHGQPPELLLHQSLRSTQSLRCSSHPTTLFELRHCYFSRGWQL